MGLQSRLVRPVGAPGGETTGGLGRAGLVAVAAGAVFLLAQLLLVSPGTPLGWDESLYVSQFSAHVPAGYFSAPRARGITLLVAPVARLTLSTEALRIYLAVLSSLALAGTLWIWRRLLPPGALALTGLLFAGLWITLISGSQAMPNLWVAFGALAAVGCFLRAAGDTADRWALAGLALSLAFVALMRPLDAAWLAFPLVVAALLVRSWRRPALVAVMFAGLGIGAAEWVAEAYVRFGGVPQRLHVSSRVEGGMGLHFALDDELRALNGPQLCRPCVRPWRHRPAAAWWAVLPFAVLGGLAAARAEGRLSRALVPTVCAATMSVPYLFMIDYAAPRFLLPVYALLSVPVATGLWWLATRTPARARPWLVGATAVGLLMHLGIQQAVLARVTRGDRRTHGDYVRMAADLNRLGVRAPCTITGDQATPVAYQARCAWVQTRGPNTSITVPRLVALSRRQPVAVLIGPHARPPAYARAWPRHVLSGRYGLRGYSAYISPVAHRAAPRG
ncbi:hypothetical protein [Actinomadura logoneensis]|uniref:hypothetical protein n=1 Tax=Actinomadura logoneensis TaxID=2293572 RepID=UPI0011C13F33|nr:hypothetical protein [Actinomadura logoneensis]